MKKSLVVLSGAGISAESGLGTFRGSGGLWEGYDIMEVASIAGWRRNPEKVIEFYNFRREAANKAQPNAGHRSIAELEARFDVKVITQNVDLLHEKAGSSNVLHLHGRLDQLRSLVNPNDISNWVEPLKLGDKCDRGSQLRPNIVWFGEAVPLIETAAQWVRSADILVVVGTSLQVYPAASLVYEAPAHCQKFLVDPQAVDSQMGSGFILIQKVASLGLPEVVSLITAHS
jgi:NAD-dependent deacetylase